MHRLWTRALGAAVMAVAFGMPAQAADWFQLQSLIGAQQPQQLCARPDGGYDGARIRQLPCGEPNDYSQFWTIEGVTEAKQNGVPVRWARFRNVATLKCLDLTDGNTADWTPLQQWTCNFSSTTMRWGYPAALEDNPDALGKITSRRSGKCVDVQDGAPWPGTVIQNFHCFDFDDTGNPAQFWHLIRIPH